MTTIYLLLRAVDGVELLELASDALVRVRTLPSLEVAHRLMPHPLSRIPSYPCDDPSVLECWVRAPSARRGRTLRSPERSS